MNNCCSKCKDPWKDGKRCSDKSCVCHGKGWEKAFEEKCKKGNRLSFLAKGAKDDIKSFIRQVEQKAREEERERVIKTVDMMEVSTRRAGAFFGVTAYSGKKRELANLAEDNNVDYGVLWDVYNSALTDLTTQLKEHYKNN